MSLASSGTTGIALAPVVAVWEGRIAAVGGRASVEAELEADGLPLPRFARLDAAGGCVRPGLIDPHTHLLFAGSREDELVLRQEARPISTSSPRVAGSCPRSPRHVRVGVRPLTTAGAGSTRCSPTVSRPWRPSRATGSISRPSCDSSRWRTGWAARARSRSSRPGSVPAVPPEFRSRPDGAGLCAPSPRRAGLPGIAAHGRARFADVFCEEGVFTADQSRRILQIGPCVRPATPTPCR